MWCRSVASNQPLGWNATLAQLRWASKSLIAGGDSSDGSLIRNVGFMAHVDAGKTSTTERVLYYAGLTRKIGSVDEGTTVMDYLQQEKERGITISSATISFPWRGYRINLIDTPGHVDFGFEVERCLHVLDGAIVLFDGTAGVEAQSVAVWRQASRLGVPRVAYVNKMDRPGASLQATVESMRCRLDTTPLVAQLPLGTGRSFRGLVDLVTMTMLSWEPGSDGKDFIEQPLAKPGELLRLQGGSGGGSNPVLQEAINARASLADQVVTMDTELLHNILEEGFHPLTLPPSLLRAGIGRLCCQGIAVPVLCGSAQKSVGIQPLMDAMVDFLPSPDQTCIPHTLQGFCAFAFKQWPRSARLERALLCSRQQWPRSACLAVAIFFMAQVLHDSRRGALVFLRLYAGTLRPQSSLYNATRHTEERVTRVLVMTAGEAEEVAEVGAGCIAVAVGLKNTVTGDTLVQSPVTAMEAATCGQLVNGCIPGFLDLLPPQPVFTCSVEPASLADQQDLEHALVCLTREDPSLQVAMDTETGQTVLSGMGQLHLEVTHHRLCHEFRVPCSLGRLRLAYRESLLTRSTQEANLKQTLGGKRHSVAVCVTVGPATMAEEEREPELSLPPLRGWEGRRREVLEAVRGGVANACMQGPLLAYPVQGLRVEVKELEASSYNIPLTLLSACVAQAVTKALTSAEVQVLEPLATLEVLVPERWLAVVLADLSSQRRARICAIHSSQDGNNISASAPMATLTDYSTVLRSLTSGTGSFSSAFSHYEPLSPSQQAALIETRGYPD